MKRTVYCGHVCEEYIGRRITVAGWVLTKRDMGGVIFIDLRDCEGVLQVVFDAQSLSEEEFRIVEGLRNQSVIYAEGKVRLRDEETVNPKIESGRVELFSDKMDLVSTSEALPFPLDDDVSVREDLRLKYRYLDLRRPSMINNLKIRHRIQKIAEDFLDQEGFLCIETPMLTKSTPEGARDYLVPSRVHSGTFYALPQSPQIFKQLLMVGGVDKYYQIARCFRDEDLRADRQPEFTQVDMEMSFVDQEDVLVFLERLFKYIFRNMKGQDIAEPFPRLTWKECMDLYGSDKPDIRFGMPIIDISGIARTCDFSVFREAIHDGGIVRAINVTGGNDFFTRTNIEQLTENAVSYGAKGMAWIAIRPDGEVYSLLTKFFSREDIDAIIEAVEAKPGDFIIFCADILSTVRRVLGNLRLDIGDMMELRNKDDYKFLVVTDFPQFEYSEEENRYVATHHPFTMPYEEDIKYLLTDPGRVRAQAYDIVLNGSEIGSGSVRIHRPDVQKTMFEALGFHDGQIESRFGFMINAFRYGTPPHAGFAFGLDRFVMLMTGANSLREVIAFPKTKDGSCLLTGAPDFVDSAQLKELNLDMAGEGEGNAALSNPASKQKGVDINVDKIATLAKLSFRDSEKERMKEELGAIIGFADTLSELDTADVDITAHVVPIRNVFRKDVVHTDFTQDEILENAKTKVDGYIYVPRVVE